MNIDSIVTDRLIIVPMTYKMVSSVLNDGAQYIEALGYRTNGKWPRQDTLDILPIVEKNLKSQGQTYGFGVWMIVKKDNMAIIGDAGFKGEPDENGETEIGYGLIEGERRKGYGYEAVSALLSWAFSMKGVKKVKADCLIDNIGSISILKKCGMHETSRDAEMIYWEIDKQE